jgi:hypothetical protein
MDYEFTFSPQFKGLSDDYKVYVHFWRSKIKEMLMVDDHDPGQKFSQWKVGDTVRYSRTIFRPKFLDELDLDFEGFENVNLTIGIYQPAVKDSKIILYDDVLNIQSASLTAPEIIYEEGWYQEENDTNIKNQDERTWRWVSKKSVCIIQNPKKEALLEIRGGVDKEKLPDQKIIFKVNDHLLEEFIPEGGKFTKKYVLTPAMMGNDEDFKFIVETDQTFVPKVLNPAATDERVLGLQVYFLYFRENTK